MQRIISRIGILFSYRITGSVTEHTDLKIIEQIKVTSIKI